VTKSKKVTTDKYFRETDNRIKSSGIIQFQALRYDSSWVCSDIAAFPL
jgi:hypothetical protein